MAVAPKGNKRVNCVPGLMGAFFKYFDIGGAKNGTAPCQPPPALKLQPHWKHLQRTGCFMIRDFSLFRLLGRFFGCFLIQNLTPVSLHKARVTMKTPYTLYAMAWVSAVAFLEGSVVVKRVARSVRLGMDKNFGETLASVVHLVMMAEAAANVSCALLGSRRMLEFFRKCALHEKSSGFRPPTRRDALERDHWLLYLCLRLCVLAGGLGTYGVVASFHARPRTDGTDGDAGVAYRLAASVAAAGFMFYDCVAYLVLRSACGVLVWYLRAQRDAYDEFCRVVAGGIPKVAKATSSRSSGSVEWACLRVESVRLHVSEIKELKGALNGVWSAALFVSAPCLLWVKCSAVHAMLTSSNHVMLAVLVVCHTVHSSAKFVELAFVSQCLRDEAQKLRESIRATTTCRATDSYFKQVKFLHDSISPAEWCMSGGGFFRLDRPLIVSMMSALITYAVILVQTHHELAHHEPALNATSLT
ncbi:uncharacterized protein [Dermacentor albipictus]|uniref:uncharacterized protein isoform X2 n=1 Tax=Dermacentor albipictus TaxID=60249 RepID=UPI0038FC843D